MFNRQVEPSSRSRLVRRSSILTIIFIVFQSFIPANAIPIQPKTDGFLYDTSAYGFVAPGVQITDIDTPFLNHYINQTCGNDCTYDDYSEAILRSNAPTVKLKIPNTLLPQASKLTPAYTTHTYKSGYTVEYARGQFKYSSNQPTDQPTAFKFDLDPAVVNPFSVIIGDTAWGDCVANQPCLTFPMSWSVTQTPPSDFTPGSMKATGLYKITKPTGYQYHIIADSPVVFPATTNANRINGWQFNYGNYGMRWSQPNSGLTVLDIVEPVAYGATYTSSTDGTTKWAFYDEILGIPAPESQFRQKTTDTWCTQQNVCVIKVQFSTPTNYTPNTEVTVPITTPEPNSIKNSTKTELEVNNGTNWETVATIIETNRTTQINDMTPLTKQCALGDEKCIISLWKATPNGYVQCTIGNVNVDCSEYVTGVDITNPQIANLYQCRINGVTQTLDKCQQIEGKYNQPVPLYTDPDLDTAPLSCAPSGLQLLNPLAYVQSTACVFQYLFIPKTSVSDYYQAYKLNIEGTLLMFPISFTNNFIQPLINEQLEYNENDPQQCLGLLFTIPVDDVLDGTIYSEAVNSNMNLYPFQACSEQGKILSNIARTIEGALIYLFAGFTIARILSRAIGIPIPFINDNKNTRGGVGNV